jgi:hypothetical protein
MRILHLVTLVITLSNAWGSSFQPQASSVLDAKSQQWIISNFEKIKGQERLVCINPQGECFIDQTNRFIPPILKRIETILDYIQLLASDLLLSRSTNKLMLLEGFILWAIIQGDVWPVDYVNPASKPGGDDSVKRNLLNAARIAAYAITYRMGLGPNDSAPLHGGNGKIKHTTKWTGSNVFFLTDNKKLSDEYGYASLNISGEDIALNRIATRNLLSANTSLKP